MAATILALTSLLPVGTAAMITGDFSQMVYKPSRRAVYQVLRFRWWIAGASIALLAAALIVHLTFAETSTLLLIITGGLVALQLVLGFVMSPYIMFPSVRRPRWLDAADGVLDGDEPVIGLEVEGDARAYPVKWSFRPHLIEDVVGGEPVVMSYCLLSNLGLAFRPELAGSPMRCIMPIQWENNMVIWDSAGGRMVQQIDGDVLYGPNTGERLSTFPTRIMTWDAWRAEHPDTKVLDRPKHGPFDRFVRSFIGRFFLEANRNREAPMFPTIDDFDDRLPNKTEVIGVEADGAHRAYTIDHLRQARVVNDTIGAAPIVITSDETGDAIDVFRRDVGGRTLAFQLDSAARLTDTDTGSVWDSAGEAVDGALAGARLDRYPHSSRVLWFAWSNFHRQTELTA